MFTRQPEYCAMIVSSGPSDFATAGAA